MTETQFIYWLQGFVEIQDSDTISEKQWLIIKDHLKLVFDKKTPDLGFELEPKPMIMFSSDNYDSVSKYFADRVNNDFLKSPTC